MPGERRRPGNYFGGHGRSARQVKNMCARAGLRSPWRTGNAYHPAGDGQRFLRTTPRRKLFCGQQTTEEDNVKISVRDVGDVKIVDVSGDVDLGTSPVFRRTLFDALPVASKVILNLQTIRYIDSSGVA